VRRFLGAKNGTFRFCQPKETRIMPRLGNRVPKYRKHKQSGQAVVTLGGRDYPLGPPRHEGVNGKHRTAKRTGDIDTHERG
jgi:hypothetical protein